MTQHFAFSWGVGPIAIVVAWQVYVIAQSSPEQRPFRIIAVVSALAVVVGLALLRYFRPDQPPSKVMLLGIALVLIAIAVLFRHHSPS